VWISEIMLQQTQVATALPYFNRFVAAYPDAAALSSAPEDEVMALWAGLGYYSRARNVLACAREQVARYGGHLPATVEELRALPGFGPYTVAAVGSLAFGLPLAVLDGNVMRVLTRLFAIKEDVGRPAVRAHLQSLADDLLEREAPGDWNEALMELGATLCQPRHPQCPACPLRGECRAARDGNPQVYPVKAKRAAPPRRPTVILFVQDEVGRVLARRRGDAGMLRALWELPCAEDTPLDKGGQGLEGRWAALLDGLVRELSSLGVLEHGCSQGIVGAGDLRFTRSYSHFQALVLARRACLRPTGECPAPWKWLTREEAAMRGFSARDRHVLKEWTP